MAGGRHARPIHTGKTIMPIVTIQITREGSGPGRNAVTSEEKAALIQGTSQLLLDVLNKPLDATFVVIEEVDMENFGWGGLPVAEFRKLRQSGKA
jgi:4-oxalocrotonate tautomerase